jgi:hypothetical protein
LIIDNRDADAVIVVPEHEFLPKVGFSAALWEGL